MDMKEIGAGLTEGLLGGLGQSITQGYRRRQRIEHDTQVAQLQTLVNILHDPDFRGDPEARKDVLGQYFDVLGNMQGGGGKGKGKGKGGAGGGDGAHTDLESTRQFVEKAFEHVYPSGKGRPDIAASQEQGPAMPIPGGGGQSISMPIAHPAVKGIADSKGPLLSTQEKIERVRNEAKAKAEGTMGPKADEVRQEVGIRNQGQVDLNSQLDEQRKKQVESLVAAGYDRNQAMAMVGVTPPHEATPPAQKSVTLQLKDGTEVQAEENPRVPGQFTNRLTGAPIDKSTIESVVNPSDQGTGELRTRATAIANMKKYPAGHPLHEAAKAELAALANKDKGQITRNNIQIITAQEKKENLGSGNTGTVKAGVDFTEPQKRAVDTALNALTGVTPKTARNKAFINRYEEGLRIITAKTGVTREELSARSDRRQAAAADYKKLRVLNDSATAFENAIQRHGAILVSLRSSLPDTDITRINAMLQSGLREINTGGMSANAVRYALAAQALRNEYARVIAGGTASIAQTPPEALKEAAHVMNDGFSKGNVAAMVDQMKMEVKQRTGGVGEMLASLQKEMRAPLVPELTGGKYEDAQVEPAPGEGRSSSKPIVQHSPSTGQYRHSVDGGKTWLPGKE